MRSLVFASAAALILVGCTFSRKPARDFLDDPLAGQMEGENWDFAYAFVDPTIDTPEDDDMVIVMLPYLPKDPCPKEGTLQQDARIVMISVPMVKKLTRLKSGSNRNAVFQYLGNGKDHKATVVRSGKVKLDTVGGKKIDGRLFARHNDANWVSGRFSAHICEYADFQ